MLSSSFHFVWEFWLQLAFQIVGRELKPFQMKRIQFRESEDLISGPGNTMTVDLSFDYSESHFPNQLNGNNVKSPLGLSMAFQKISCVFLTQALNK